MVKPHLNHENYLDVFSQFMNSGNHDTLLPFLEKSRPAEFLSVYRNGYVKGCVSALVSNFPCLNTLLGDTFFSQLAASYATQNPPIAATLVAYGFESQGQHISQTAAETDVHENHELPESYSFIAFLQREHSNVVAKYPYIVDISRLDQAWLLALNSDGEHFLSAEAVQQLIGQGADLAALPIKLSDSCQVVTLEYDLFKLWSQLRFQRNQDSQVELAQQKNTILFWQLGGAVQAKLLTQGEAALVLALQQHASFDQAITAAIAVDEQIDISSLFADLLNAHLLKLDTNT